MGGSDRVEENHRHYHSLVRLIKKEIGDKQSQSMKYLRQLLPFPKQMDEVKKPVFSPAKFKLGPLFVIYNALDPMVRDPE